MIYKYTNYLLNYGDLLNVFVVDMYAKIETERLLFIRLNQKTLRADSYEHWKDAINNDIHPSDIGKSIILPSTFTRSARYMHQRTQHAMTYVSKYGNADLFNTITCNPKCLEITEELKENQKREDQYREDIVARVFRQK